MRYLDTLPAERHGDLDAAARACGASAATKRAPRLLDYLDGDRYPRFVESFTALLDDPAAGDPRLT